PAARNRNSVSASDVVVPAGRKDRRTPAPDGGGLAIYDEKGKLIYGSPIQADDDTAATKTKTAATRAKTGAGNTASPVTPSRDAAAPPARGKAAVAENPASGPNLIEGRYVRLKPDLAESLLDQRVEPEYPDAARRAHIQGSVILETLIGANGKVQETTPVSGPPQLADAAAAAVRQWKYKPFTVDGQKVPIRTQVTVTFMLAQ
ncbi:MAG TPA: energy transducer TonB, partial [Terriglobales bacterium]|nr:energy transducer TonB [Terriglobales bacterium]